MCAALEEDVLVMHNARRAGKHHRNGIEAYLVPVCSRPCDVALRRTHDFLLFFGIDRPVRRPKLRCRPRLYLNEHQRAVISRHNIDFRIAAAGPVIPANYHESGLLQKTVRQIFSPPAHRRRGIQCLLLPVLARRIAYPPEELFRLNEDELAFSA